MSERTESPSYDDGSGTWRPDPNDPYLNAGWEDAYPAEPKRQRRQAGEANPPTPSPQPLPAEPPTVPTEGPNLAPWASRPA